MNFFAYGTLQFSAVVERVCGRSWAGRPAALADHACYHLRGQPYPGVVAEPGGCVRGTVYCGLNPRDLRRLDRYEGTEYLRRCLSVRLDGGEVLDAWVYLPRNSRQLSTRPWHCEEFARREFRRWLRNPRNGL